MARHELGGASSRGTQNVEAAMASYMVTAHNKDGRPLHISGLMSLEAARAKGAELWSHGFARITVTDTDTLVEVELPEFHRRKRGT